MDMIPDNQLDPAPHMEGTALENLEAVVSEYVEVYGNAKERQDRVNMILRVRGMHERDDYSFRAARPGIFKMSNIAVPLAKAVASSLNSKVEDEIWGNDAAFIVEPVSSDDRVKAMQFDRYWSWELEQAGFEEANCDSLAVYSVEGTSITKRRWSVDKSYFGRTVNVLHGQDGQPVRKENGDYIEEGHPMEAAPESMVAQAWRMVTGSTPPMTPVGMPNVVIGEGFEFAPMKVKGFVTHYENAESAVVPFEDFICKMDVARYEESPFVGHQYDLRLYQLWERIGGMAQPDLPAGQLPPGWILENVKKLLDVPEAKDTPSLNQGQLVEGGENLPRVLDKQRSMKEIKLVEGHLKYDVDGDGIPEDIFVLFERNIKKVVFCDYLVRGYRDCKLPYTVYRMHRVTNRWYGVGPYEYCGAAQDFMDVVFNRMNFRTGMSANPQIAYKPGDWDFIPPGWEPGGRWIAKSNVNPQQAIHVIALPALEAREFEHFNYFVQLIQLITGIQNASQGDISSLPSSSTATGITAIIEEGNKLFRRMIRLYRQSLQKEIEGMVNLIQQNVQQDRVARFDSRLDMVSQTFSKEDIRGLKFDVRIVVSKLGKIQRVDAAQKATQAIQVYIGMPPQYQIRLRNMFVQLLESLGMSDADALLPTEEELMSDQAQDGALKEAAARVSAAAAQLAAIGQDPTKQIVADLTGVTEMLMQMAAQPPQAGGGQPAAGGMPPMASGGPAPMPPGGGGSMPGASMPAEAPMGQPHPNMNTPPPNANIM